MIEMVYGAGVIDDAPRVASVLGNAFTFLLTIAGVLMFLAFVLSGIVYVYSHGNERVFARAKSMMISSLIGVVVILSTLIMFRMIATLLS